MLENMHTLGAHVLNQCTQQPKYAQRVLGTHLISNTETVMPFLSEVFQTFWA